MWFTFIIPTCLESFFSLSRPPLFPRYLLVVYTSTHDVRFMTFDPWLKIESKHCAGQWGYNGEKEYCLIFPLVPLIGQTILNNWRIFCSFCVQSKRFSRFKMEEERSSETWEHLNTERCRNLKRDIYFDGR